MSTKAPLAQTVFLKFREEREERREGGRGGGRKEEREREEGGALDAYVFQENYSTHTERNPKS